jgi:myosin heavy subunit
MDEWKPIESVQEIVKLIDAPRPPPPPPSRQNPQAPPPPPMAASRNPPPPAAPLGGSTPALKSPTGKAKSITGAGANGKNGWSERVTSDGVAYYHNSLTDSVTWDKPNELKTDLERRHDDGEWVWVTDPSEAWVPAKVLTRNGNKVTLQMSNGSSNTVTSGPNEPLWPLSKSSLTNLVDDMVMVDSLNPAQMIHLLKSRYLQNQIYTWVGASHTVLVSINPFKLLPIYTVNTMTEFAHPSPNKLDPPHTFAIASSAYYHMRQSDPLQVANQAILISGESGAGKTEATKQCFNFLAEKAGSETGLEQKILNANPVLEAFGNAKTLRNNNSSRFGRWTAIHFSSKGSIIGASIENYLLEKSRVVFQNEGERNYHIFYQLCACKGQELVLDAGPETFRYLNQSNCVTAPGIDDQRDFSDVTSVHPTPPSSLPSPSHPS